MIMTSHIDINDSILILAFLKVSDWSPTLVTQPLAPMVTPRRRIDDVTLRKCSKIDVEGLGLILLEKLAKRNRKSLQHETFVFDDMSSLALNINNLI